MITDPGVFEDAFLPYRLLHRDQEISQLSREFRPIVDGEPGGDALISGPSGVGKTALARHTLDRLESSATVEHTHIRCLGLADVDILIALLEAVPGGPDDVDDAVDLGWGVTAADELTAYLQAVLDEPFVVVLDEADGVAHTSVIEQLVTVPQLSIVVICHEPNDWLARLARADRSRFDGEHHLRLDRYGVEELLDILWIRAKRGLSRGVIDRDQLRYIADEVAGVARYGIQTVHAAAELADKRGHEVILNADVDDAFSRAQRRIRKANLHSMPFHHHLLYALIHDAGEIAATDLHARYDELAEQVYYDRPLEPIGRRSRRNKLQKLTEYGLIEWSGEHQHRRYRPVNETIAPPIEIDLVGATTRTE